MYSKLKITDKQMFKHLKEKKDHKTKAATKTVYENTGTFISMTVPYIARVQKMIVGRI